MEEEVQEQEEEDLQLKMEIHFWHMQKGSDQDTKQEVCNKFMCFFFIVWILFF